MCLDSAFTLLRLSGALGYVGTRRATVSPKRFVVEWAAFRNTSSEKNRLAWLWVGRSVQGRARCRGRFADTGWVLSR